MVFWAVVFILISFVLLMGNFYTFPSIAYQLFPLAVLLGALGILYSRYTAQEKEASKYSHYYDELTRLQEELEETKRKVVQEPTEIMFSDSDNTADAK